MFTVIDSVQGHGKWIGESGNMQSVRASTLVQNFYTLECQRRALLLRTNRIFGPFCWSADGKIFLSAVSFVALFASRSLPGCCVSLCFVLFTLQFIRPLGLSYGVIMVVFLGALVPAVANRNFQYQSKERRALNGLVEDEMVRSMR